MQSRKSLLCAQVSTLFAEWDADRSGTLTRKELHRALAVLGIGAGHPTASGGTVGKGAPGLGGEDARRAANALFASVDVDGSGEISLAELERAIRPSATRASRACVARTHPTSYSPYPTPYTVLHCPSRIPYDHAILPPTSYLALQAPCFILHDALDVLCPYTLPHPTSYSRSTGPPYTRAALIPALRAGLRRRSPAASAAPRPLQVAKLSDRFDAALAGGREPLSAPALPSPIGR